MDRKVALLLASLLLAACIKPIVEPTSNGRYLIDNRTGSGLQVEAETPYGPVTWLADSLPPDTITAFVDVSQCSGGHVLPSNFFKTFALTTVDSLGNAVVVYSGVRNGDWMHSSARDGRMHLTLVVEE